MGLPLPRRELDTLQPLVSTSTLNDEELSENIPTAERRRAYTRIYPERRFGALNHPESVTYISSPERYS